MKAEWVYIKNVCESQSITIQLKHFGKSSFLYLESKVGNLISFFFLQISKLLIPTICFSFTKKMLNAGTLIAVFYGYF